MDNVTVGDRMRYRFDNWMARGVSAQIALLILATAVVIVIATLLVSVVGLAHGGVGPMLWVSLLHVVDNGNISNDSGNKFYIAVMLVVTLAGLTVVAALFGIVTNAISDQMEQLRRGRSRVLESGHTLILGWSPQVFTILSELMVANENQRRASVVVLSEQDKPEMEAEIRARVRHRGHTRIICRTGNPLDLTDLEIGNPQAARSIIILPPEAGDPDTHVIKTLLALTHSPHRRSAPYHIVAPIREQRNLEVARMAGGDECQIILGDDMISRLTVQTCRQSGLSVVYTELLDFDGDEIYMQEEPRLIGMTFGHALSAYESSAVIGLLRANGGVMVNPPADTVIEQGDRVIAISEDDDTVVVSAQNGHVVDEAAIRALAPETPAPESTLIFNWTDRTPGILTELDAYVAAGSVATVVVREGEEQADVADLQALLRNLHIDVVKGDPADRAFLDRLDIPSYAHVIVLGEADTLGDQEADARTLTTLLHLRSISDTQGATFSVVSEMADVRNRELASATRADDFIVSDQMVSLMLSQLSENSKLQPVFDDLFDPEGSEIYLKPMDRYVEPGKPVNFYTVLESAKRRGEIAIGYRIGRQANDAAAQYGVTVNPAKSNLVTFDGNDRVIVLAED